MMNAERTGALIRALRTEKGMTQKQLAKRLCVSDKAVSKWERGLGCPDIAMLRALEEALGASVTSILTGGLDRRRTDGGNMKKIRFYVCPSCGNVITATGGAEVACCGMRLEALPEKPCDEAHALRFTPMDGEMYIDFDHGMTKEHYIRFIACAGYDRVLLVRLYPEQGSELRVPYMPRCTVYIGCSRDGLLVRKP